MAGAATASQGSSAVDRIRASAIELFGERGFKATSLRSIAERAGVSQALIVHHFGSKDALRVACDRHVADLVRASKVATMSEGPRMDPFLALRRVEESRPLLRYLARALSEGGSHLDALIDDFVADAEEYMAQGEQAGWIKPSADPRGRVIVLILWSFGALVLHEQLERLLGVDLLGEHPDAADMAPYFRPVLELYTQGLLREGAFEQMVAAFVAPQSLRIQHDSHPPPSDTVERKRQA